MGHNMALSDLFADEAAEPMAATPAKPKRAQPVDFEIRLSEARAVLEKAEAVLAKVVRANYHGENNGAAIEEAMASRYAAEKGVAIAQQMLEVAKDEANKQAIKAERDSTMADWSKAIALAEARAKALKSLSQTIRAFAEEWIEVKRLNEELYGALPAKLDLDAAKMRLNTVADLIRKEMCKQGVEWADETAPSVLISFRPFDEIMAETPAVIRGWREQLTSWADDVTGAN